MLICNQHAACLDIFETLALHFEPIRIIAITFSRRAMAHLVGHDVLLFVFLYTGRQTFGFAIPGIERELGISKPMLGWASAAMLWTYALGQSINGNLGDKFGGRRLMSLGALLSCGLNWVVSFGNSLASLTIPWAVNGYAQSMGWAPGSRCYPVGGLRRNAARFMVLCLRGRRLVDPRVRDLDFDPRI